MSNTDEISQESNMSISDCNSNISELTEDLSVINEINDLIEQCHALHDHIHNSYETLKAISSLISNKNNIKITYDNYTVDFDDLLEMLHTSALIKIQETGESNFNENLLDILERSTFSQ